MNINSNIFYKCRSVNAGKMSHLPLDARAILQHLNELGYRNISAEQLREFLKGKAFLRNK